jgi:hypothetical protein
MMPTISRAEVEVRDAGRRAIDPDYAGRHLPIVDLESLPAELAALVPGLAGQHPRSTP